MVVVMLMVRGLGGEGGLEMRGEGVCDQGKKNHFFLSVFL